MSKKESKIEKIKKVRHKARFALPNLVTLGSVFCSFLSMSLVIRGMAQTIPDDRIHYIFLAALAILGSIIFDLFDGKVARWTHTSTKFGMEMDSLADGVSFGVAPAVLIYGFALQQAGIFGIIASFLFVSGALLRLARFNIEAPDEGVQKYFKGLPSPAGAAGISAIVLAAIDIKFTSFSTFEVNTLAFVAIGLGLMMVSNISYKTLKGEKTLADKIVVIVGVLFFASMCFVFTPSIAFFLLYCYFIGWGLLLTVYLSLKRGQEESLSDAEAESGQINDSESEEETDEDNAEEADEGLEEETD